MNSLSVQNHEPFKLEAIPFLNREEFQTSVRELLSQGGRMAAFFVLEASEAEKKTIAVIADPASATLHVIGAVFKSGETYSSFAREFPQTNYFECELAENSGIGPKHHPWLRPVRRQTKVLGNQPYKFYEMKGEEVHEVAVGPIHAGIIEPGHFRFQCHGELVHHLEINLGYQHRGVEALMVKSNPQQQMTLCESIAGDTVLGHGMAYALAVETLAGSNISLRAQTIRCIAEEVERVAMHLTGLGGVANDVGFAIGAASYGRLRTLVINSLALLCGSRFGRGLVIPGGVRFDFNGSNTDSFMKNMKTVRDDIKAINEFMFNSTSVLARLENTGIVSAKWALAIGMVGPAARSSGVETDVRSQFPYGAYKYNALPAITLLTGDAFARARIRSMEIEESIRLILDQVENLPQGSIKNNVTALPPHQGVISLTEGWRGEIAHAAFTDRRGQWRCYKIKDPSFNNWYGLALALRQEAISDFPLCNKSFDLSYAGHDL